MKNLEDKNIFPTFAPAIKKRLAQMAESVDALVSNTSGATHPGSTPGLSTEAEELVFPRLFFISSPRNLLVS